MMVVGRIFFVNGLIGGGSPPAGKPYWNAGYSTGSPFVNRAKGIFSSRPGGVYHEPSTFYTTYAFDPAHNHLDCGYRRQLGYRNADTYQSALTQSLDRRHHSLVFVTHSMGGSYSEGMMQKLKESGWAVHAAVHLNPFQPAAIVPSTPRTQTIHYQNPDDPVTCELGSDNWVIRALRFGGVLTLTENNIKRPGRISGANYIEHHSGLGISYVHASPEGDVTTWDRIQAGSPDL